jgi:hypothetical protein
MTALPQVSSAYLPDQAPVTITVGQLRHIAEEAAVEALKRVGLQDDEAPKDIWVLRNLAWFARLWTRRAVMCGVGLFFLAVAIVGGGFLRKWLG